MRNFELKADGPGFWAVLGATAPIGWITKSGDEIFRACRHTDGFLTRHPTFTAALLELVQ